MADISLHNAEIIGMSHAKDEQELLMHAQLKSGERCQIVFEAVEWWELCSFGLENIISVINTHDTASLTNKVIDEQDISDQHVNMVRAGSLSLFVLQAIAGLSGWIIAKKMVVRKLRKSSKDYVE